MKFAYIGISAVVLLVALSFGALALNGGTGKTISRVDMSGSADAALTIIEYSDFQCPYCARAEPTVKKIKETYGNAVSIEYRQFPLDFHENARAAAEASECAREQGKFWEYHDVLFANQASLSVANYKEWAADMGLDTAQFNSCLDSGKYAGVVNEDIQAGVRAGVSGTPTFFVNGQKIVGAQPFSVFQSAIDSALGEVCTGDCTEGNVCDNPTCGALQGRPCGCS